MLDFLNSQWGRFVDSNAKLRAFTAIVEHWDFFQLAQTINGQTFFKVFLSSISLKAVATQVIVGSKME